MTTTTIAGRTALVTGANRGIGRALAEALLARGAQKVYIAARNAASLKPLVDAFGERVVPLTLDVTNPDQVNAAAAAAPDVDLLVNNAGVASHGFTPFTDPAWIAAARTDYEVNVIGTFQVTQAFAPILGANGGGTLVNISSVAGLVSFPVFVSYATSKAALHSLTQATRFALREQGTTVLGVYPGPVDTEMAEKLPMEKVTTAQAADAILDGIEAGTEEIYPDPTSQQIGPFYFSDPKGLERHVTGMFTPAAA